MPLDDEYKRLLDLMDGLGILEPYSGCSAEEIRARMAPLQEARKHAGAQMASEEDRKISLPGYELAIRIYRPNDKVQLPVVVYFHGGGFVFGGLDSHAHVCRELADRVDAIVVSVDYRLAPEHRFPKAVDDAFAAVCWVAANAASLGGDGGRLAVAGDSAGATLATVSAIRCRDEGGPALRFQLLIYPGTDARGNYPSRQENAEGYFLTQDAIDWFFEQYLRDDRDRQQMWVSPILAADLAGLPPALIVTAEFDPLRDEGEAYAARLQAAGVPSRTERYDGAIHGFFGASTVIGESALQHSSLALAAALRTSADATAES